MNVARSATGAGAQPRMEPTDIELMLMAQAGNAQAFHALMVRYRAPLRRFFAALLPDPSQADDFAQETFLRLWATRSRYEPTGKFSTYLFQIGKHYWLNQRQRLQIQVSQAAPDGEIELLAPACDGPETAVLARERQRRVRQAIADLPEHYRVVFVMSHFENRKYADIAAQLQIPVGTVKSRMAEAVRRLRLVLAPELELCNGEESS